MTTTRTREEADDIDGERKFYVFDLNTQEELHAEDTPDEPVLDHDDDKDSHIIIIDDDEPPRPQPRARAPPLWSVDAYEAGTCPSTCSQCMLTSHSHTRELVPVHQVRPAARASIASLTPCSHACVPNMKVFSVVWDSVAAVRPHPCLLPAHAHAPCRPGSRISRSSRPRRWPRTKSSRSTTIPGPGPPRARARTSIPKTRTISSAIARAATVKDTANAEVGCLFIEYYIPHVNLDDLAAIRSDACVHRCILAAYMHCSTRSSVVRTSPRTESVECRSKGRPFQVLALTTCQP
jgi:hypothetical protein